MSRTKEVDLVFFYFPLLFLFSFWFNFHYSIFRTRIRVRVTRSHCHTTGYIRWHGHKSHDTWKKVEGSGRMTSYNGGNMSRLSMVDLVFIFFFYFILFFVFFLFCFLFLEQLGLRSISHAVTSVTNWWQSHKTDHETWRTE